MWCGLDTILEFATRHETFMFCYREDNKPELSKQWHCLGRLREPLLAAYYFGQALFLFMRAASPYTSLSSSRTKKAVWLRRLRQSLDHLPTAVVAEADVNALPGERPLCSPPLPEPLREDHVHLPSSPRVPIHSRLSWSPIVGSR